MDSALNLAMSAQGELLEAVERLRETEEELEETKKKVLFLQKQKATRRVRCYVMIQPMGLGGPSEIDPEIQLM